MRIVLLSLPCMLQGVLRSGKKKRHLGWLFTASIFVAWAPCSFGSEGKWDCSPIEPMQAVLPEKPCFRAILSEENRVTLQWRVRKAAQRVYIYSDSGPNYRDIGYQNAACEAEPGGTCSLSFRVQNGGYFRWLLKATHDSGQQVHVAASINIPWPFSPTLLEGGGFVDMLAPTSRTFSWSTDQRNAWATPDTDAGWVELSMPGERSWQAVHYPRSGPEARFIAPASVFNRPGDVVYGLRDCHYPSGSEDKYCSPPAYVLFHVGSDQFLGHQVIYVPAGEDLEIAFTRQSGDLRVLSSPTLIPVEQGIPMVATTGSTHRIDGTLLTQGVHRLQLASCVQDARRCSNRQAQAGIFGGTQPENTVENTIRPLGDELVIVVDSPVDWEIDRPYTKDFYPGVAHSVWGHGEPLDITYDDRGGAWLINEFSNSIEHLSSSGELKSYTIPLARSPVPGQAFAATSKPFSLTLDGLNVGPASISMLTERATLAGSILWFTQGGGLLRDSVLKSINHSRVISFNPDTSDSPTTPYDDRLCVYNVPADDQERWGNNQVIGLAASPERIWIGESRGLFGSTPSAISAFVASPARCGNLLNFQDPEALARQELQYCGTRSTTDKDGCMEKFSLQNLRDGIKVAHLEKDPIDGSIWFTDAHGRYLGNLNPARPEPFTTFQIPNPHSELRNKGAVFGGFPWSLRVDDEAVYLGEYTTGHILRFDKKRASFDEIFVPMTRPGITLHSIDIDVATDRLWFTLANEVRVTMDKSASTIGYIDLASWRSFIANPQVNKGILAVIYSGLDTIAAPEVLKHRHQAFRGIAIDQRSGKVALATMWRGQITELSPLPAFWR